MRTKQALDADLWWRENRDRAPDLFTEELEDAMELISRQSEAGFPPVFFQPTSEQSAPGHRVSRAGLDFQP